MLKTPAVVPITISEILRSVTELFRRINKVFRTIIFWIVDPKISAKRPKISADNLFIKPYKLYQNQNMDAFTASKDQIHPSNYLFKGLEGVMDGVRPLLFEKGC